MMRNSSLIAELFHRHAESNDRIYLLVLKELDMLYATIEKISAYAQQLEKENGHA